MGVQLISLAEVPGGTLADMNNATPTVDTDKPRRFRRLRIAVSVFFGVLTVALVLLWMRSYTMRDRAVGVVGSKGISASSWSGEFVLTLYDYPDLNYGWGVQSIARNGSALSGFPMVTGRPPLSRLGFRWQIASNLTVIATPIWVVLLPIASLAAAPWLSCRFSLQTVFVTMTLVAVLLGLFCYTSQ